ncbi:MAG: GumC family protein [Paracoccaceae bacterium]
MKHDKGSVLKLYPAEGQGRMPEDASTSPAHLSDLIADVVTAIRRSLPYVAMISIAALVLSLILALNVTPKYEALGRLVIDQSLGSNEATTRPNNIFGETMMLDSEVESLMSRDLLSAVALRLGEVGADEQYVITETSTLEERGEAIDALIEGLSVERVDSTFVIDVRFEAETPELAATVVNLLMEEFRQWRQSVLTSYMQEAAGILGREIAASDAEVAAAERRVEEFKNEFASQTTASVSVLQARIDETSEDLFRTELILGRLDSQISAIQSALADPQAITSEIIEELPASLALDIGDAAQELRTLAASGENPIRRGVLTAQIENRLTGTVAPLDQQRSAVLPTVISLRQERDDLNQELADYRAYLIDLRGLERQANALAARHVALLGQLQNTRQETNLVLNPARILQTAVPPLDPTGLGSKALVLIGTAAGLMAALAFALIREQVDGSFRNSRQLTAITQTRFFGSFPLIDVSALKRAPTLPGIDEAALKRRQRNMFSLFSIGIRRPNSRSAKALGRTVFGIETEVKKPATISVISALGSEGKSVFSSNLAFALAEQGYRVLLVDGDRRNRGVSEALEAVAEPEACALDEQLAAGGAEFRKLTSNLFMIYLNKDTAGKASGLISAAKRLQATKSLAFDYIVVDTPPLAFMPEAMTFVRESDASILAVKWGSTKMSVVERLLGQNPGIRDALIGAVFCLTKPKLQDRYEYLPGDHGYYDEE